MTKISKKQIFDGILGFAIGDALGVPVEFMSRSDLDMNPVTDMSAGGEHGQVAGTWSDDTSLTLATVDSLTKAGVDYKDLMERFSKWLWEGDYSARGEAFDVGGTTKTAIFNFNKGAKALESGEISDWTSGNGSLMRILPIVLYLHAQGKGKLDRESAEIIHNYSKCTHANPRCLIACGIYAEVVFNLLKGYPLPLAIRSGIADALAFYNQDPFFARYLYEFANLVHIFELRREQIKSTGYVVDTLYAVLWCLANNHSYEEVVLSAVNLGDDTDTIAAIAGGAAGLVYGVEAMPADWLHTLAKGDWIKQLCTDFYSSLSE
ncbi:ADP-ribosylglycohydrolase family protein [Lactobacillus pasteurii DSM 23907 = CRBIP 24.76]|uniref:ADP-ribosylglycohydrolase n=1 Tax=Lactobacillus pasteurii DSM 23907 = CRBIP 24.76 TaxID=1423790 RepID=I7LE68_9LACO|nr:ADP-ribosylglycohydrolase family protein [Lactobacillus pasteurii]KRK07768.1 ADP-ribosylglycohydrolase family protein [Lactobacillus pasteurii DSM 23907 = CRBIP 24.76]TDG77510.1 hypothetical protein C5L33_000953 [Lactobacillus pasteurii]CCI85528.1 Putative uncharacterized protein [Lactobacillus pasteurii DSM 23907 = CRBIP 24.76]